MENYYARLDQVESIRAQYHSGKITQKEALHLLEPETPAPGTSSPHTSG